MVYTIRSKCLVECFFRSFQLNQRFRRLEDWVYFLKLSAKHIDKAKMPIGVLSLHLFLPGCTSLKEKRSRIKPLLARLHREFNISAAEMDQQDAWQESLLACALISNDPAHIQRSLQTVARWVENNWPDISLVGEHIELI